MLAGPDNTSWGHKSFFVPTTWNPADKDASITLSNGDMTVAGTSNHIAGRGFLGIDLDAGGSAYFEANCDTAHGYLGVGRAAAPLSATNIQHNSNTWVFDPAAGLGTNTSWSFSGVTLAINDTLMVAVKGTELWWGKNGVWMASGDPAAGTNAAFSNLSGIVYPFYVGAGPDGQFTCNFGQSAFTSTPPAGFTAGWGAIA